MRAPSASASAAAAVSALTLWTTPSTSGATVETTGIRPPADEVEHRRGVDVDDVAHQPDVDRLAVDGRGAPGRGEQAGVLAREPDGVGAVGVDEPDELAADLADEHHPHHVHGLGRGDAQAAAELALHAEPAEHARDLGPAAVDDHGADAGEAQEDHVLGERPAQRVVGHGVAAVLDDDHRALEALQPRQRLGEHAGLGGGRVEAVGDVGGDGDGRERLVDVGHVE